MNLINNMLVSFWNEFNQIEQKQSEEKLRIKKEWQESKKLPRKAKKKKRKELIIDWNIANW